MKLTMRKYQNIDDLWKIRAFLREVFLLNDREEWSWQTLRLDYWYGRIDLGRDEPEDILFIWEDEAKQIKAALTIDGKGQAYLQIHPDYRSAELIEVSNSSLYLGEKENKTIEEAVTHMGRDKIGNHVQTFYIKDYFFSINTKYPENMQLLWEHSVACAFASQLTAEELGLQLEDDVFTIGLLHDAGKLVLYHYIDELGKKDEFKGEISKKDLAKALKINHARFGADFLKMQSLPETYVHTALFHDTIRDAENNPDMSMTKEFLVVHFANLLVKSMGLGKAEIKTVEKKNMNISINLLKLSPQMINNIILKLSQCTAT